MADTHLRFSIGSTFSGEGFRQAQQAIVNVNKNVNAANGVIGNLSGAIGQMDTSMIKGASAVTGMVNALATMNVTTIVVQGAMMAFNLWVQKVNDEMEELTKRSEKAKEAVEKAFDDKLSSRVSAIRDEIKDISKGFENLTKAANAVTAAIAGIRSAEGQGDIIALQTEKLQKMLEARTESERQQIEKSYEIMIAKANLANVEAERAVKENAASQAVVDAKNRVANIEQQAAVVSAERAQLEEIVQTQKMSGDENWIKTQKRVTDLKEIEASLEEKRLEELDRIEVLDLQYKKVKQESINEQAKANNQLLQVQLAQESQVDATNEQTTKTMEAARKTDDLKWAEEDRKNAEADLAAREKESADLQKRLNDSQKGLKDAQDEYRKALLKYSESIATNDYYKSQNFKGGSIPVDIVRGISLDTADAKVDDAIRNGAITTVRDADRMRKDEARQVRDRLNSDSGTRSQEAIKYQRLLDANQKALNDADRHFMQEYEKILDSQKKQKEAVEKSREKVEKQTEILEDVLDKLKELGLK